MKHKHPTGFILPAALVFSLVTIILTVTFLQYTTSFNSILRTTYHDTLAKKAAETGARLAADCFRTTIHDLSRWDDGQVLTPNKECAAFTFPTKAGASEFISEEETTEGGALLRTTYEVEKPEVSETLLTITAKGTTQLFSSHASPTPAFVYEETSRLQVPISDAYTEIAAAEGNVVTDFTVGLGQVCAVANMSPYCWGINVTGQLGIAGDTSNKTRPYRMNTPGSNNLTNETIHKLGSGPDHVCGIASTGKMYCWGMNAPFGTIGIGSHVATYLPPQHINTQAMSSVFASDVIGASPSVMVSVTGTAHSLNSVLRNITSMRYGCAIAHGRVSCVGQNWFAQLGQIDYSWLFRLGSFAGSARVYPTAHFTMWAFGTGVVEFLQGNDKNSYHYVFGYDKAADSGAPPYPRSIIDQPTRNNLNDESNVGKFNASEVLNGQTNACANENGKIHCWGDQAMPWVMSQNEWLSALCPLNVMNNLLGGQKMECWTSDLTSYDRGNVVSDIGVRGSSLSGKMAYGLNASHRSNCAIAEGRLHCWGQSLTDRANDSWIGSTGSQLWELARDFVPLPWADSPRLENGVNLGGRKLTQIGGSSTDSLACFNTSGTAYCLGKNGDGQPNRSSGVLPFPGHVERIESGRAFTCGQANGALYCTGRGSDGQLGRGNKNNDYGDPQKVLDIGTVDNTYAATAIDAGEHHNCAIVNGDVYCWGDNAYGQLGTNDYGEKQRPTRINLTEVPERNHRSATAVSAGKSHSCAVMEGDVYCWGDNTHGQLGTGNTTSSIQPVRVNFPVSPAAATDVSVGDNHTCAVVNGRAYCWGFNSNGQLGTNNTTHYTTPQAINICRESNPNNCRMAADVKTFGNNAERHITQIEAGKDFTCAIGAERVWCWGSNAHGKTGRGTATGNTLRALEVNLGSGSAGAAVAHNGLGFASTELAVGDDFACALVNQITHCWGDNTYGQLGRNSTANNSTTQFARYNTDRVQGFNVVAGSEGASHSLTAGKRHACSVTNGQAMCWGDNTQGQLGRGSAGGPGATAAPVYQDATILGTNLPHKLAAGSEHTCAIANGKIACWGHNNNYQNGILGDASSSAVPRWTHPRYAVGEITYDWERAILY